MVKLFCLWGNRHVYLGKLVSFFGNVNFRLRRTAWITLPLALLAMLGTFPGSVRAVDEPGLLATVYNNFGYNGSPPMPEDSGRPAVGQMTVSRVEQDFDQSPPFNLYEDFIVQYEGYVTSPISGTFNFLPQADDGTKLYIDDVLVQDDWRDKGGGGEVSSAVTFEAGVSKKFEMWFYENGGGAWTTLYWNINGGWEVVPDSAFTKQVASTTTTTLAPYFNSPTNLTALIVGDNQVKLTWEPGETSNVEPHMWNITWFDMDSGERSGGWGIWTYANTLTSTITLGSDTSGYGDTQFTVSAGTAACVGEGQGSCLYGPAAVADINISAPTTTTSTTSSTSTTTSTIVEEEVPEWTTTTVITPPAPVTTTEPEVETPPSESDTEGNEPVTPVPQYAPEQETPETEAQVEVPEEVQATADEEVADIFDGPITDTQLENAVDDLVTAADSPEELTAVVNSLLDQDLTDEQFSTVIDTVFSEPLSDDNFSAAIDAVFSEPLSDEKFDAVIDAVLDQPLSDEQFEELVGVLESDTVSEEQVAAAVDSIIETGVTEDQATELATSEKVLQSIDGEQATEIFAAVEVSNLTVEEAAQLVEAVQDAPTEVRESMESEINVFDGAIDTYVPLGSAVDVGTRRVVIAAVAVASSISLSAPAAPSPSSGSPSGGGGPSSPQDKPSSSRRRR